jgi:hypothetical protein
MDPQMEKYINGIVEFRLSLWAEQIQTKFTQQISGLEQERKETLAICKRLGLHIDNLELKMKLHMDNRPTDNSDSPGNTNNSNSNNGNEEKVIDLFNRVGILEQVCGYDIIAESNLALSEGSSELILESRKIESRLERLESALGPQNNNNATSPPRNKQYQHQDNNNSNTNSPIPHEFKHLLEVDHPFQLFVTNERVSIKYTVYVFLA